MAIRLAGMERARPGSTGYPIEGDPFKPTFHPNRINQILNLKGSGKKVFVDSMGDLFSDGVRPDWLEAVVEAIRQKPDHVFLALTKWTENIGIPTWTLPNMWLGTSVTCQSDVHRIQELKRALPKAHKFISFEPLHGPIDADLTDIEWVIIGAETGNCMGKVAPDPEWVEALRKQAERKDVPVFFKDNLRRYCYAGMHPQQYPEAML